MSGTKITAKSQSTFPSSSIQSLQSSNAPRSFSAQIIKDMSKMTGHSIENAARVMDSFWDYVSNHRDNWRKEHALSSDTQVRNLYIKAKIEDFHQEAKNR
ncbi:MAG: hypothetical protein ACJ0K4_02415 [Verrucomicrobiales bacterium]